MDYGTIIDFILFAAVVNAISFIVAFVVGVSKAATLDKEQYEMTISFMETRSEIIVSNNPLKRLLYYFSLIFLPVHGLGMNLIYMYYALFYSGSAGIIGGMIKADEFTPFNMVSYNVINYDQE